MIKNLFQGNMHPLETSEVIPGIWAIKDGALVNMYLISSSEGYIAIDAGTNENHIQQSLMQLAIDPSEVIAVLLTHSDYDHTGSLGLYKNANIYLNSYERSMIDGSTRRILWRRNTLTYDCSFLEDRSSLRIGERIIHCMHTPGHTLGSMCFLVDQRYLFTGDMLAYVHSKIVPFPKLFTMNPRIGVESVTKILGALKEIEMVFTGHHGNFQPQNGVISFSSEK